MARVFVSFLGIGGPNGYAPAVYRRRGEQLTETRFVQAAIIESHGADFFDRLLILVTKTSRLRNLDALSAALSALGVAAERVNTVEVSEQIDDEAEQWRWFESVLGFVDPQDELFLDMTHGFRIVPIVLSGAIGYLQAVKDVRLGAVYYGADQAGGQIIDFSAFYRINAWADAVSRLVERADADKLARLAEQGDSVQFQGLRDPEVIAALRDLTGILTNIDVHAVAARARRAVALLRAKLDGAGEAERRMLTLAVDKFASLTAGEPTDGRYTGDYLQLQLEVARMLLEHGLLMQAFTVMRELVGSIGMAGLMGTRRDKSGSSAQGRQLRRRFAEAFVSMVNYDREAWTFTGKSADDALELTPWYERLRDAGALGHLESGARPLGRIRNGFDHAWTAERLSDSPDELRQIGMTALSELATAVAIIKALTPADAPPA